MHSPSSFRVRAAFRLLSLTTVIAAASACGTTPRHDDSSAGAPIASLSQPIIGGVADTTDDFVVGIWLDLGGGAGAYCSGTLIAPNLVLSARHCVSKTVESFECTTPAGLASTKVTGNYAPSQFTVSTNQDVSQAPQWGVKAIYYPDEAACDGSATDVACRLCGYDLSLLELDSAGSAFPTRWIPPATTAPTLGKFYQAIGYGCQNPIAVDGGGCDPVGFRMLLDPIQVADVQPTDFTVGGRVCGGDSGGPTYDPIKKLVYGALSRGDGPNPPDHPEGCNVGVYTRVDIHNEWLKKHGLVAATHGGYAPLPWMTASVTPPAPDAGVHDAPAPNDGAIVTPVKSADGAPCGNATDCASNVCINVGGTSFCSQTCTADSTCSATMHCASGYCLPGAQIAASVDAGGNDATPTSHTGSGCALVAPETGPRPVPWFGIVSLAAVVATAGRRRRRE